MLTLIEIADAVHANALNKGFHEDPLHIWWPKMLLNQIGEISEVWEADRSGKLHEPCDKAEAMKELGFVPLTNLEEEYADMVIRALDQSRRLGIDILRAVQTKHAYNVTRPYKHGRKH